MQLDMREMQKVVRLLDVMAHVIGTGDCEDKLLLMTFVYANKFVEAYKRLDSREKAVNLMLISLLVTGNKES